MFRSKKRFRNDHLVIACLLPGVATLNSPTELLTVFIPTVATTVQSTSRSLARFQVLTVVLMNIQVFRLDTSCEQIHGCLRFKGALLDTEYALHSSKRWLIVHQSTRCNTAELNLLLTLCFWLTVFVYPTSCNPRRGEKYKGFKSGDWDGHAFSTSYYPS
jgi:hypothetical protein